MAALDAQLCLYLDAAVERQEWGRLHQCRRVTHAVVRVIADGGGVDAAAAIPAWRSDPVDEDQRRTNTIRIRQTCRVDTGPAHPVALDLVTRAGATLVVEVWGVRREAEDLEADPTHREPRKVLLGTTGTIRTADLAIPLRETRPTAADLRGGPGGDEEMRRTLPLESPGGADRGTLACSIWVEPTIRMVDDFDDVEELKRKVLGTAELTLVVKAVSAFGLRQPDIFRKPWPFVSVELQMYDAEAADRIADEEARLPKAERQRLENKRKKKKKKKKKSTRNDPLWPKIAEWESYEIDGTVQPEWDDVVEFRLAAVGFPALEGGGAGATKQVGAEAKN